jgi:hypothetical protein
VEGWLHDLTEGPGWCGGPPFRRVQLERLGKDDRPLIDRLPLGLVGTVEQSIHDYLPVAIERIGAVLSDPEAKGKIHRVLRTTSRPLGARPPAPRTPARPHRGHRPTFTRLLDGLEREGFERFAESLSARTCAQLTRAVNDGWCTSSDSLSERLARMGPEKRAALAGTLATGASRSCATKPRRVAGAPWTGCLPRPSGAWNDLRGRAARARRAVLAESLAADRGRRWVEEA